jgi:transposase
MDKVPYNRGTTTSILGSLRLDGSRELIESVGAYLEFLPPYSPELNPIEMMWSKVKSYLRGIKARTQEDLEQAIGKALSLVCPNDAKGWFSECYI